MELRCVLAVIRHGDRTPKQKIKMGVTDKRFFELFEKEGGYKKTSQAIKANGTGMGVDLGCKSDEN